MPRRENGNGQPLTYSHRGRYKRGDSSGVRDAENSNNSFQDTGRVHDGGVSRGLAIGGGARRF